MDKTKLIKSTAWATWALLLIAMAVLFGMILKYPFRETSVMESFLSQSLIPLAVIVCNFYLFTALFNRTKANIFRCAVLVIVFGVVSMASSRRGDHVRQLNWKFDGSVARKFNSNNHGAKTIEIKGLGEGNYEFVDDAFWDAAQPGDRIVKEQYSAYAVLNSEKRVFIQGN